MKRSLRAIAVALTLAAPAVARDHESDSSALKAIHAALAPSVVQVDAVVQSAAKSGIDLDVPKSFFGVVTARDGQRSTIVCPGEFFDQDSALDSRVTSVTVRVAGGKDFPAEFLAQDDDVALAFLRVDDADFPGRPAQFAADDAVVPGDFVATVRLAGPSFGFVPYVDAFLVSAIVDEPRCFVSTFGISDSLGAPVAAFDGRVIGVIGMMRLGADSTRRDPATGAHETSLFAPVFGSDPSAREVVIVPIATFRDRLAGPRAAATPSRPAWLGVEMQVLLPEVRRLLALDDAFRAVQVTRVLPDSPAAAAGVQPLDLVFAIDDRPLECVTDADLRGVKERIAPHAPGDAIRLSIRRGSDTRELPVTLADVPVAAAAAKSAESDYLGVRARDLVYADRAELELASGAGGARLTAVKPAGRAGLAGARVGDLVLSVNGAGVASAAELADRVGAARATPASGPIVLFVRRGRETRFLKVE